MSMLMINPLLMGMQRFQDHGSDSIQSKITLIDDLTRIEDIHARELFAQHFPAIRIDINGPEEAEVGEEITYIIIITNDREAGNGSPIRDITLLDELGRAFVFISGDVNNNNLLEVKESWRYERSMRIQRDDPDLIELTAIASGMDEDANPVNQRANIQLDVAFNPHIDLIMAGSTSATIGETVTFHITVTNQILSQKILKYDFADFSKYQIKPLGNVNRLSKDYAQIQEVSARNGDNRDDLLLSGVIILVAALVGLFIAAIINILKRTRKREILVFCVVIAILSGIGFSGLTILGWLDDLIGEAHPVIPPKATPITLQVRDDEIQVVTIGDGSSVGEIEVSNPGDIKISYIGGDTDEDDVLDLGESWLYSFSYTTQQNDPELLFYPVIVTGKDRDGDLVTLKSSLTLEVEFKPVIVILKTGPDSARLGEPVTYGFTISNDPSRGDGSPVSQVAVTDGIAGLATYISGDRDEDKLLEVGESWIYTVTHTFLGGDPDPIDRTVIVTGQDTDGKMLSYSESYPLNVGSNPALQLVVTGLESARVGDSITLTIEVSNDVEGGDGSPIGDLSVSDTKAGEASYRSGDRNDDALLSVGERWVFELPYTILVTDPGPIEPTFVASGQDQDGELIRAEYNYILNVDYNPVLTVQVSSPDSAKVGDQISYQINLMHDTGSGDGTPVKDVMITGSDGNPIPLIRGDSNQNGQLDTDEEWLYKIGYTIQPDDPVLLVETIRFSGIDLDGDLFNSESSYSLSVDFEPALSILTTGPETASVNDRVTHNVTLTNNLDLGDGSPLREINITDNLPGLTAYIGGDLDGDDLLEVGESWTYTYTYTIQENDPDPIEVTLIVSGLDQNAERISTENTIRIHKFSPLANGDFEILDTGWDFQNNGLRVSTIQSAPTGDEDIPMGSNAALLGGTGYACRPEGVPMGYAEVRQSFTVPDAPDGKTVGLRFNYVIYSQDASTKPDYDRFEVYINESAAPVFSDGNLVNTGLGCNVWWRVPGPHNIRDGQTTGWANGFINLERYQGQTIQISFQNHNRFDGWYNTYTYLDNVEIVITE